jgi:hypothetical protein
MSDINDKIALRTFDQRGDGAISFRHKNFYILIAVKRIKDKSEVNALTKQHKLEKPADRHIIKSFGFRIVVTGEDVEIFEYSKHPMTVGDARWLYSVQKSRVHAAHVCTISLRVSYADKPTKVDFLTKQKIEAALEAYKYGVEQCEVQLRTELMRIYGESSHNLKEELKQPEEPFVKPEIEDTSYTRKPKKRQMIRFKSRS